MMFRWIGMWIGMAAMFCTVAVTPAQAEPKTATDKIADAFMALDTDTSESVSYAEYKAMVNRRADERFAQMDADHNGEVSEDEYRAFWRERESQHYRLQR